MGTGKDQNLLVLIFEGLFGNRRQLPGSVRDEANKRWVRSDLGVREDNGVDMGAIMQTEVHLWDGDAASRF